MIVVVTNPGIGLINIVYTGIFFFSIRSSGRDGEHAEDREAKGAAAERDLQRGVRGSRR